MRTSVSISPTLTFKVEQTRKLHRTPPEQKTRTWLLAKMARKLVEQHRQHRQSPQADPEALLTGMTP